ncbi:hypothetical protein N9R79_11075 [Vibrio sp.]|nr:hypothetical protein [Vibrio sp.]
MKSITLQFFAALSFFAVFAGLQTVAFSDELEPNTLSVDYVHEDIHSTSFDVAYQHSQANIDRQIFSDTQAHIQAKNEEQHHRDFQFAYLAEKEDQQTLQTHF